MSESHRAARDKWRQIIDAQRASGLTAAAYCRGQAISQASFSAWKRRLLSVGPTPLDRARDGGFVEVAAAGSIASRPGIEVRIGGHRRGGEAFPRLVVRRGFDPDLLIELIGVMEGLA
jgi:hypothetical protein